MMIKATILFLLCMVLAGMIGRLFFPRKARRLPQARLLAGRGATCATCGRHVIGTGPCDCTTARRKAG